MDIKMNYSPDEILKSMDKFFEMLKFSKMKSQLIAAFIALSVASPAYAIEPPEGLISYTKFILAINEHLIDRVKLAADGRTAEFLNSDGARGSVNLLTDPNLLKILTDN